MKLQSLDTFAIMPDIAESLKENTTLKLSDGRILGYAQYGDPNGVPLFFFHGWPSSRLQGIMLHEAGKKLGVRIISPDRPGFGLSTYDPKRILLDWPQDVLEIADHLKIKKFAVLGQ